MLAEGTKDTPEVGKKLRNEICIVLQKDASNKTRRYHSFLTYCKNSLEENPPREEADIAAFHKASPDYTKRLKADWDKLSKEVKERYNDIKKTYFDRIQKVNLEDSLIKDLRAKLSALIQSNNIDDKRVHEVLDTYFLDEKDLVGRYIKLYCLIKVALRGISKSNGILEEKIDSYRREWAISILKREDV